ncbi:hypothetical protein BY996DRAFT_8424041 [Phakopsora pachyrhizi]|nr:hypothetical protein BY996DRAFT_6458748 [Phakopsora pachyrhizi]KAI8446500.1 hypothetical protein BY996DRAFT_6516233 [Phakopsora pachyrhizi]KAI8457587.1 hypothetical protein BY996DRAFT_8424041 [Phakopsora pachyrhizi]
MTIRNIRQNINQNRGRMNSAEALRQSHKTSEHQKLTSTTANPNPKPEPKMRICMDESLDVKQIGISRILLDDLDSEGDEGESMKELVLIGQQILSIQDGLREKGTDLFGVEDLSIPRTNLNHGYSSRRQNPFSLGERGVDMIGDKINQLKRNSISAASSPALPLVSTFMVPFAHHFDHKPISHMNRNSLIITTGTTTTTVLFTPTAITTCMIDPTNAARVVTAAIKDT